MKLRTILFTLLVLPLAIGLAYLLKDYVVALILAPLIYTFQILRLLYEAFPQAVWWGLFSLVLTFIAWRSLMRRRRSVSRPVPIESERVSRARTWTQWVERVPYGDYSRWLFARQVADLTMQVFAHQERLSLDQVNQQVKSGRLYCPPEIQAYIQLGLDAPSFRHYSDLVKRLRYRYRGSASPLELDPEQITEFLEAKMKTGGTS